MSDTFKYLERAITLLYVKLCLAGGGRVLMATLVLSWLVLIMAVFSLCLMRASGRVWGVALLVTMALFTLLHGAPFQSSLYFCAICGVIWLMLNFRPLRMTFITKIILKLARRTLPPLSNTEREAIESGNIGWEAVFYTGEINFSKLKDIAPAKLSKKEKDFIHGPLDQLCGMLDNWSLHKQQRIPEDVLAFLKKHKFFGLIIPESYSGLGFGELAHSEIISKIASCNASIASLVSVPNSLGPAELLLKYGTDKQKNHLLPRLASGKEVPCFALTSQTAGSDAGSMIDYGVVCKSKINDKQCLAIRLNWSKRYITLSPIATLMGLAFKLYDPEHLLGDKEELGITCALISTDAPGITIGRRHNPLNATFPNGPIKGKNVVISVEDIIGGVEMVGKGWGMLMECLAAGRSISLPAVSAGAAKKCALATGAYSYIRRQFDRSLCEFGGVQDKLANIVGNTYLIESVRNFSMSCLEDGQKSLVASGICKYHVTELGRIVIQDAMDVHAGKAICLGPKNYIAELHQTSPISITVEGANILTRCMMIFGQGLMRCHPFLLKELKIINKQQTNPADFYKFDEITMQHARHLVANIAASMWHGLTNARTIQIKDCRKSLKRRCQIIKQQTVVFSLLCDFLCIYYGGKLKFKEQVSSHMSDIHSYLYITSAVIYDDIHNEDQDMNNLVKWSLDELIYKIHYSIAAVIKNMPNRVIRGMLKLFIFPLGVRLPCITNHRRNASISEMASQGSSFLDKLQQGCYVKSSENNPIEEMLTAAKMLRSTEDILNKVNKAHKEGLLTGLSIFDRIKAAGELQIITADEADKLHEAEVLRQKIIAVDDFDKLQTRY